LLPTVSTQRNFVADFLQVKCDFTRKTAVFELYFGGIGVTYDDYLRFIGKRVLDLLLVLIELFSLGVTAEALRANIGSKSALRSNGGRLTQNFR